MEELEELEEDDLETFGAGDVLLGEEMDWDAASKMMSQQAAEYEMFLKDEGLREDGKPLQSVEGELDDGETFGSLEIGIESLALAKGLGGKGYDKKQVMAHHEFSAFSQSELNTGDLSAFNSENLKNESEAFHIDSVLKALDEDDEDSMGGAVPPRQPPAMAARLNGVLNKVNKLPHQLQGLAYVAGSFPAGSFPNAPHLMPRPDAMAGAMSIQELEAAMRAGAAGPGAAPMSIQELESQLRGQPLVSQSTELTTGLAMALSQRPFPPFQHGPSMAYGQAGAAQMHPAASSMPHAPLATPGSSGVASADVSEPAHNNSNQPPSSFVPWFLPLPRKNFTCMSKQDLAYVMRAQLNQLQITVVDPLADDFYFQVWQAGQTGRPTPYLGFPPPMEHSHSENRQKDGSFQLEGSLGRIAASNLSKPKRLMSLGPSKSDTEDQQEDLEEDTETAPPRRFMFSRFSVVFLVEEGLKYLMQVEDVDSYLAAIPPPQRFEDPAVVYERESWLFRRDEQLLRLSESLDLSDRTMPSDDHLLFKFAKIPKGRTLVYRALHLLSQPMKFQLLALVLFNPIPFSQVERAGSEDLKYPGAIGAILQGISFDWLIRCFEVFLTKLSLEGKEQQQHVRNVLQTQIGAISIIWFMRRGTQALMLFRGGQPGLTERLGPLVKRWSELYQSFLPLLEGNLTAAFEGAPRRRGIRMKDEFKNKVEKGNTVAKDESNGRADLDALWEVCATVMSHAQAAAENQLLVRCLRAPLLIELQYRTRAAAAVAAGGTSGPTGVVTELPKSLQFLSRRILGPGAPTLTQNVLPASMPDSGAAQPPS
eukprot:gb/GEZN01002070.1/.p1 GENE.gb/GEZN01002070.1/~~gb/GEZN01002070.1/.p1  ORF type:complete len:820 (+),score=128.84 gb/GEZN01002070.1/:180-2639(+)